ncbi:MAG: hypothetical protein HXK67_02975 [Clostridiales bacterium]|nr:hypothetical protein [Clostridiales bacterium]
MRDSFLRKLIAIIVQIIVLVIIFVVFKNNKYINKKYTDNVRQNVILHEKEVQLARRELVDIIKKYRNDQLNVFYKEAGTEEWYNIKDESVRIKFCKIVLDIYKNEKLSVEEKTFLEGFLEGVLENNAGFDKFKDFKNEIENAIKNEV